MVSVYGLCFETAAYEAIQYLISESGETIEAGEHSRRFLILMPKLALLKGSTDVLRLVSRQITPRVSKYSNIEVSSPNYYTCHGFWGLMPPPEGSRRTRDLYKGNCFYSLAKYSLFAHLDPQSHVLVLGPSWKRLQASVSTLSGRAVAESRSIPYPIYKRAYRLGLCLSLGGRGCLVFGPRGCKAL